MSLPNDFEGRCKMLDYILEGLIDRADNLSEWEDDFVHSVAEQYEKNKKYNRTLTDRQCELVEQIYNKYF